MCFLGIDVGTTGVKVAIFDEDGTIKVLDLRIMTLYCFRMDTVNRTQKQCGRKQDPL